MTPYWTSPDGAHVIYCGDALEVLPMFTRGSVHALIADPPYSSGSRREGAKGARKSMNRTTDPDDWFSSDCMTTNGFVWMMRNIASQSKGLLCRGGHVLTFIDWRMSHSLSAAIESADLRYLGLLVWDKMNFGMGRYFRNQHELILHFSYGRTREVFRHDTSNVFSYPRICGGFHDTEKPVALLEDLIKVVTDREETILDPFTGSGTTGVACIRTGRKFIGIEIEERYCEIAVQRMIRELSQPNLPGLGPETPRQTEIEVTG